MIDETGIVDSPKSLLYKCQDICTIRFSENKTKWTYYKNRIFYISLFSNSFIISFFTFSGMGLMSLK